MKKISYTGERLKEYMKKNHLRQTDILEMVKPYCDELGAKIGKSDLSQYISGKSNPGQTKLSILANALHVDEAWLMGLDVEERAAVFTEDMFRRPAMRILFDAAKDAPDDVLEKTASLLEVLKNGAKP